MRKLKNTLYITSTDAYLSLEGENIVVLLGDDITSRVPLHNIEGIVTECVNYGQRVQNSVFECEISSAEWLRVKHKLINIIDETEDSLRFYYLGDHKKAKTEHIGKKPSVDVTGVLIV